MDIRCSPSIWQVVYTEQMSSHFDQMRHDIDEQINYGGGTDLLLLIIIIPLQH